MNQFTPSANNLLEAYQNDPMIRERLNSKGLYLNFSDSATTVSYYLTQDIKDSSEYHDFVEIAMVLTDRDSITLLIDSPGGYLSGANLIITALNSTEAYTTAVVTDCAASAATIIALACDNIVMTENSYFMVHAVSFGSGGKLHEVAAHTEFTIRKSKELIARVYEHFLTSEEIERVIDGAEIYIDAEEVKARWVRVQEAREAKIKEAEAEQTKGQIEHLKAHLKMLEDSLPKEKPVSKTKK